jgi:3-deoxy-7-phosphoheptulonate synthase
VILRGSGADANYGQDIINKTAQTLHDAGLPHRLMVDCSHGNSQKDYTRQPEVLQHLCSQVAAGSYNICGVMLESHLVEGRQDHHTGTPLVYGQSITDACISWEMTVPLLEELAVACEKRRDATRTWAAHSSTSTP